MIIGYDGLQVTCSWVVEEGEGRRRNKKETECFSCDCAKDILINSCFPFF